MCMMPKFLLLSVLCGVGIGVSQADDSGGAYEGKASADTPESRLMWDLMDQWPFDPSATLPISEDDPHAIQMTGRILAAALCMKSGTTTKLNGDIAEVIESMRVYMNGDLTTADDWNSVNALNTWTFPDNEPSLDDTETTGLVILDPDNGWRDSLGSTFGFNQAFLNAGSYEGEIRSNDQRIIVSFRGTDDLGEGLTAAYKTAAEHRGILYWHGAVAYYRSMEDSDAPDDERISKWLDKFDAKNKKVYFIGHSLGGAAATIAIRDFALRTQDYDDPNYNQYQYAPTLHTIGAPPTVHCSSTPGWLPGGGWLVRLFTRVVFRCRPNRASNVSDYENTKVNIAGSVVPLRNHLHYWANVRDPAPFQWTPKNWKAWYLFTRAANTLSHVGTLRELYLGSDDQPDFVERTKEPAWTIKKYTGIKWSTFQNPYDQTWRRLWTDTIPLTEYHDQRHYANGLEHDTITGEPWWSRLYGPTTDDDSIFAWQRDADGNDLSGGPKRDIVCGEKGNYHDGVRPFEATVSGPLQESAVKAGGSDISISLKNDTWVGAGFDAQRQPIIEGLKTSTDSAWNNEVISQLSPDSVVRESKLTVKITLAAAPNFEITANESVAVYVPATALQKNIKDLKGSKQS